MLDIVAVLLLFVHALVAVILKLLTAGPALLTVIDAVLPEKLVMVHPLLTNAPEIVRVVVPEVLSAFVMNVPLPFMILTDAEPLELELVPENV